MFKIIRRFQLVKINRALKSAPYIQLLKITDPNKLLLHRYNFQTTIDRRTVYGNGFSFDESMALIKAWAEFLERYGFNQLAKKDISIRNSNGFACHTSLNKALEAAENELIERDVFLVSWLLNNRAKSLDPTFYLNKSEKKKLTELEKLGFIVKFGVLAMVKKKYIGVVIIKRDNFITVFSSCKNTLGELTKQLLLESVCVSSGYKADFKYVEKECDLKTPLDHQLFYCHKKRHRLIENIIDINKKNITTINSAEVKYEKIELENGIDRKTGFYVARALSSGYQELWFGSTKTEYINLKRLKSVAGSKHDNLNYNLLPHPIV